MHELSVRIFFGHFRRIELLDLLCRTILLRLSHGLLHLLIRTIPVQLCCWIVRLVRSWYIFSFGIIGVHNLRGGFI